jgi:arsenite methyltransferase
MSFRTGPMADEMSRARALPQLVASSLVDGERLEAEVKDIKDIYRHVARGEDAELHFEVGRDPAEHLGYPGELLDAIPAEALASFAGVGHDLDLAALQPGQAALDLGSRSGSDVFCAAVLVGESGRVVGVDITDEQLDKAARLRDREGSPRSSSSWLTSRSSPATTRASTPSSPTASSTFRRPRTASSPRPRGSFGPKGGWPSPTSSAAARSRSARRATSSCGPPASPGRIPRSHYLEALEAQDAQLKELGNNDYRFISEMALDACSTDEVQSISPVAAKTR